MVSTVFIPYISTKTQRNLIKRYKALRGSPIKFSSKRYNVFHHLTDSHMSGYIQISAFSNAFFFQAAVFACFCQDLRIPQRITYLVLIFLLGNPGIIIWHYSIKYNTGKREGIVSRWQCRCVRSASRFRD